MYRAGRRSECMRFHFRGNARCACGVCACPPGCGRVERALHILSRVSLMQRSTKAPLEGGVGLVKTYTAAARQQQQAEQRKPATPKAIEKPQKTRPQARLRQLKSAHEAGLIDDETFRVLQRALAAELAGISFTTTCVVRHPDGSGTTTTATSSSSVAAAAQLPRRGVGKRGNGGTVLAPHKLDEIIAQLSPHRADVAVQDADVVEYCISRLLETNDGGEECLDKSLAPGCTIREVPAVEVGLPVWTKDPGGDDEQMRTTSDWVVPPDCTADSLDDRVLFLHGGVYIYYSPSDGYRPLSTRLAVACGMPVFVPDYRKAPEHRWPAAVDDSVVALRWMANHAPDGTPRPARRVFVVGDSSGGGLAAATVLAAQAQAEGISVIPLSGAFDPTAASLCASLFRCREFLLQPHVLCLGT